MNPKNDSEGERGEGDFKDLPLAFYMHMQYPGPRKKTSVSPEYSEFRKSNKGSYLKPSPDPAVLKSI